MINTIPQQFLDHRVVVYLDDILIYSKTMEEHEALVKEVLARLEHQDLAVSLKKLVLHVDTVEFRGYILGKTGVTISEKRLKVSSIGEPHTQQKMYKCLFVFQISTDTS